MKQRELIFTIVTPFVGVWIETSPSSPPNIAAQVTPFVGVWIETPNSLFANSFVVSHPSWVCGLKPFARPELAEKPMSHPSWVCGLKLKCDAKVRQFSVSHPSWVCGLKRQKITLFLAFFSSHPSWVCGLKHLINLIGIMISKVTPFVGVWIETDVL